MDENWEYKPMKEEYLYTSLLDFIYQSESHLFNSVMMNNGLLFLYFVFNLLINLPNLFYQDTFCDINNGRNFQKSLLLGMHHFPLIFLSKLSE